MRYKVLSNFLCSFNMYVIYFKYINKQNINGNSFKRNFLIFIYRHKHLIFLSHLHRVATSKGFTVLGIDKNKEIGWNWRIFQPNGLNHFYFKLNKLKFIFWSNFLKQNCFKLEVASFCKRSQNGKFCLRHR